MSVSLLQLWLPVLLGTVLAWFASMVIHVVLKYHNSDYQKLANEDEVMTAVGNGSPPLGVHTFPYCVDMAEMKNEAMQQKFAKGPVGFVTVFPPGMPNMGKLVPLQLLYFLFGCLLIAYCASLALDPASEYLVVFSFCSDRWLPGIRLGRDSVQHLVWPPVVDHSEVPAGCSYLRSCCGRCLCLAVARTPGFDGRLTSAT